MEGTKEKILIAALRLFAKNGYEAVSVSDIAGEIGITKGALYKHYKSKRSIFDSIVARMYAIDAQRSKQYGVPPEKYEVCADEYGRVTVENLKNFTFAQFEFWTKDPFADDFLKMLSLERYHSDEAEKLYRSCIADGPVEYVCDIFRSMAKRGLIKKSTPELLAMEFYAPFYLLVSVNADIEPLKEHIEKFVNENIKEI